MKRLVVTSLWVMGFTGLIAEILLLRELLIVFSGNELGIGVILANWLVLEALGCFFPGRLAATSKKPVSAFVFLTILFSIALIVSLVCTRLLKSALGVSVGETLGFGALFYSSFLLLLPVSLLHGALFPFGCRILSQVAPDTGTAAGRAYVYETLGTLLGGVACAYLLIPHLHAFRVASGLAVLNVLVCLVLLLAGRERGGVHRALLAFALLSLASAGGGLAFGAFDALHWRTVSAQWKNQNVVHYRNSKHGNLCVVENEGQYVFFLDGVPSIILPIPDRLFVEEFVHLPLLAHPDPARVLVLSGGAGGVIDEALKHPSVLALDYAELDPLLPALLRRFSTPLTESELNDERVAMRTVDGRLWLGTAPHPYDVIFVGVPEPSSLQANRFFTREFFILARTRLTEKGILAFGVPGSFFLVNEELRNLNSCIHHTLVGVFPHVRVLPGEGRNIFLASNSEEISRLDRERIVERLGEQGLSSDGFVPWHIERKLHPGWEGWFEEFIADASRKPNTDFKPAGLFYSLTHWNALYAPTFARVYNRFDRIGLVHVFLSFAFFVFFYTMILSRVRGIRSASIAFSIASTGFAGMVFSLIVILTFQSIHGYVFSWIGLLVALFMAGAAVGAARTTRVRGSLRHGLRLYLAIEVAVLCFSLALPLLFHAIHGQVATEWAASVSKAFHLLVSFAAGLLVGAQFPLANALSRNDTPCPSRTAAVLYASDLVGGWVGGMVGALFLLPVLGLSATCLSVALLKLASLLVLTAESTRPRIAWR